MDINELNNIITDSVYELFEKDRYLLDKKVNERSISHKLACYLSKRIPEVQNGGWNVDAEYNRNKNDPKKLECIEFINRRGRYPDIIIHRRSENNYNYNDDNNLLIIEIKKNKLYKENLKDIQKIKCFITSYPYFYRYGLYINLKNGKGKPELVFFSRIGDNQEYNVENIIFNI